MTYFTGKKIHSLHSRNSYHVVKIKEHFQDSECLLTAEEQGTRKMIAGKHIL